MLDEVIHRIDEHCAAFIRLARFAVVMRSEQWNSERRVERSVLPPFSEVLRDHCRDDSVPHEETLRAGLREEL